MKEWKKPLCKVVILDDLATDDIVGCSQDVNNPDVRLKGTQDGGSIFGNSNPW